MLAFRVASPRRDKDRDSELYRSSHVPDIDWPGPAQVGCPVRQPAIFAATQYSVGHWNLFGGFFLNRGMGVAVTAPESIPKSVIEIQTFLNGFHAGNDGTCRTLTQAIGPPWFDIGPNHENQPAESCVDAARKRRRLGAFIPVWDELKTLVHHCVLSRAEGPACTVWVAVHMRGDRKLDKEKLRALILAETDGVYDDCVVKSWADIDSLGMNFGLVNPITLTVRHETLHSRLPALLHVIDNDLFTLTGPPGTVMTNAGHKEWSLELTPELLLNTLADWLRGDVTTPDINVSAEDWGIRSGLSVGIITGNNPESGALLWDIVNRMVRSELTQRGTFRGDISYPTVYVHSLPAMGVTMEMEAREGPAWDVIAKAIKELLLLRIDVLAIACNTSQYFGEAVNKLLIDSTTDVVSRTVVGVWAPRFISMPEVLGELLVAENVSEVAMVGIGYVMDPKYSAYTRVLESLGIAVRPHAYGPSFYELAMNIKRDGARRSYLHDVEKAVVDMGSKHVVIALTEISFLLASYPEFRFPDHIVLIDPLLVYGEAISDAFLKKRGTARQRRLSDYCMSSFFRGEK
jgi:aspartate/glutamate racemase